MRKKKFIKMKWFVVDRSKIWFIMPDKKWLASSIDSNCMHLPSKSVSILLGWQSFSLCFSITFIDWIGSSRTHTYNLRNIFKIVKILEKKTLSIRFLHIFHWIFSNLIASLFDWMENSMKRFDDDKVYLAWPANSKNKEIEVFFGFCP